MMELSRRDLMKLGAFGSAALILPAERIARTELALSNRIAQSELPQPYTLPFATPPVMAPERQTRNFDYYTMTQRQVQAEILPGKRTTVWGYNGLVPGPTLVANQGRQTVVQQINDLPSVHPTLRYNVWTSTHLHGSCSKPQYDGYASDITDPGAWKDYEYPNIQEARTLWYHDHGVHITAPNAYMGLAAMYILHDPHELSLPIPHGRYDVPLILRDAMFQSNGELIYDDNSQSGVYGDVNLVNGVPWPAMRVERRKYRFRILNAAVSRSYALSLSTGEPLTVIATDGGLTPHPQPVGRLKVGMAERYEVVIDFSKYQIGQRVTLDNTSPKNNIDEATIAQVMAFDVVSEATDTSNNEIPVDLNPRQHVMGLTESMSKRTRHFEFKHGNSQWLINDTTWTDVVNSDYELVLADPGFNDVEIWELENKSGGWFHPIHIHLVDFKILDRNGRPPEDYEKGPKDTVYLGEGEKVRVIMRFEHQQGKYMMHCHNLVHEDHDMMAQFVVGESRPDNDPVHADPCRDLPARPVRDRRDDPDEDNSGKGGGGNSGSGSGGGGGGSNSGSGSGDSSRFTASSTKPRPLCKPKKKPAKRRKAASKPRRKVASESAASRKRTVKKKAVKKKAASCRQPVSKRTAKRTKKRRAPKRRARR